MGYYDNSDQNKSHKSMIHLTNTSNHKDTEAGESTVLPHLHNLLTSLHTKESQQRYE